MKTIALTQGLETLVDDEDYERLSAFAWYAWRHKKHRTWYAVRNSHGPTTESLHRAALQAPRAMHVDHIDGNGLNNQRSNLRLCTRSQNAHNAALRPDNTSGHKGVYFIKRRQKWAARVMFQGKDHWLGAYNSREEAAEVVREERVRLHGAFTCHGER